MDIVARLMASATSETCLEAVAAKEIVRLRKIEAAARKVIGRDCFDDQEFHDEWCDLRDAVTGEE